MKNIVAPKRINWKTSTQKLPMDKQQVLISASGVNYIAKYDASKQIFRVENESLETFFKIKDREISWTEPE